jgi:hypothetical protein
MSKNKELALRGLSYLRGDDLERARAAFRGLTSRQMQEQYGQSGQTRQQILDGYEQHAREVEGAVAWVNAQRD